VAASGSECTIVVQGFKGIYSTEVLERWPADPDIVIGFGRENGIFFGVFPMFVPSLSWQNDRFYI
jgi:hypothetical protein